jgi:hypothetical protein
MISGRPKIKNRNALLSTMRGTRCASGARTNDPGKDLTMQNKYFYYISPAKLDMLEPQLRKSVFPKITPTFKVPGVEVQVQAGGSQTVSTLTGRLLQVRDALKKTGQLEDIHKANGLRNGVFYQDQDMWHSGLFSFKGTASLQAGSLRAVSYLLWRPWNDAIILLAGSPLNVLGEKNIREGLWAGGTSGTWQWMLEFASTCLKTDENVLVAVGKKQKQEAYPAVEWVDWNPAGMNEQDQDMPMEMSETPDALSIAILCVRYLSRLPLTKVDTAFTIFNDLEMKRRVNLPVWTRALLETPGLDSNLRNVLLKCKKIYIGSPLYTAIG